jgi:hypothetical protein
MLEWLPTTSIAWGRVCLVRATARARSASGATQEDLAGPPRTATRHFCDNASDKHRMRKDPWGNAVACALAALAASDPLRRALLTDLGEFWLEIARRDTSQISEKVAIDLAMVERMQGEILGVRTHHPLRTARRQSQASPTFTIDLAGVFLQLMGIGPLLYQ